MLISALLLPVAAMAQNSDYSLSVKNLTQPTDRTIEFDVYLLDTNAGATFELASTQLGFLFNSGIYTGGTLSASISNTGSGLNVAQQFSAIPSLVSSLAGYPNMTLLRLAGRTPPGAGGGTIISQTGDGTLVTHFTLANSVPWIAGTTPNITFTSSTAINPLYATRVSQYIGTTNTALVVTPGTNALICCNPMLNAVPPGTFSVTGGGSYCLGGTGVQVGLSGSEIGVNYQLLKDALPLGSPIPGTGAPLSFGLQIAGTYTVTGTNGTGSSTMAGSTIVTTNPLPVQPGSFTVFSASVYQGATGIVYTVPNDPTASYLWSYSGTGATITGTTNSVTLSFSGAATSGNLSVTATNSCGTSAARTIAIAVNNLSTADYSITVQNLTQPTNNTLEFDVFLLDKEPSQSFELATIQIGFLINSGITGGTLSAAISNTGSGLLPSQQFTATPTLVVGPTGYLTQTLVRLAGRTPPGAGSGTTISTTGNGTLVTHFTLTSTFPWTPNSTPDLIFTSSAAINPLYATRVSEYIGTTNTALVVTPGVNALVCCNPALDAGPPAAYAVTGGGSFCQGGAGLSVDLAGSQTGVNYQLYKGAVATGSPLPGTGSSLSFGSQTAGTYTVTGTNGAGSANMTGNAVIIENPLPLQPAAFTASTAAVCQGASGVVYTVPNDPSVTYSWSYSGTGATIAGTTNSVTVSYTASATSGNLSVTASNSCGTSASRTLAVTVNNPPVPTLAGLASVCEGTTGVVYTTEPGMSGYIWFVSPGGTITNGGTPTSNTVTVTWNTAGAQSVSVNYSNGTCSAVTPIVLPVTVSANPSSPITSVTQQPTCQIATGTITVTSPAPAAGITFSIDGVTYTNTTGVFSALVPGPYNVTVKNAAGCVSGATPLTVNAQPLTPPAPTASVTQQPTCQIATGTITVTSPAPAAGVTFSIDGVTYTNTTGVFSALVPGPYNVTVKNSAGCVSSATPLTVNAAPQTPAAPLASVTQQPTCQIATGTITVTSPAPAAGITFSIDGVTYTNTTGVFSALVPGPYNVTVKNSAGCVSSATPLTVNAAPQTPAAPLASVTQQPTCQIATGTITVTSPAPAAGITFSIDGVTYTNTTGVFSSTCSQDHIT